MTDLLTFSPRCTPLLFSLLATACGDSIGGSGGPGDNDAATGPGPDAAAAAGDAAVDNGDAGPPACGELDADPAEVFVDPASTRDSVGTESCPFVTIDEAIALAAPASPRTVHLAGGDPAVTYELAEALVVRPLETYAGSGADRVVLTGGSRCSVFDCAVSVQGGALSGVTAISETGAAIEVPTGADGSALADLVARDSDLDGLYIRASTTITRVIARRNGRDGVNARTATVTIVDSKLDSNDRSGIFADRQVGIAMTGGSVNSNDSDGISLQDSSGGGRDHSISGVDVIQNLGFGIDVATTASLTLRDSVLRGNEVGVVFSRGAANSLDLGTASDPGNNHIGGATGTQRNIRSGLCIQNSGAAASQVAEGNTWQSCPPSQREIASFTCRAQNTYSDIGFIPATGDDPPLASPAACEVGP